MLTEQALYENAVRNMNRVPVPPIEIVFDKQFILLAERLFGKGIRGVANWQRILDEMIQEKTGLRVEPGIKAKIVHWDGKDGIAVGFDQGGQQIAVGHCHWINNPGFISPQEEKEMGFMAYNATYIVATDYRNRRMAPTMNVLLENHIAVNNVGKGALFSYQIDAVTDEDRLRVRRLLDKIGAVRDTEITKGEVYFRKVLKPQFRSNSPATTILKPGLYSTIAHY